MMSGPYFEQLRTRLKGLGLGRVGMKKLKNSHKGGVVRVLCECCAKISHFVVLQDREYGFEILSQKRIRTRFAFL